MEEILYQVIKDYSNSIYHQFGYQDGKPHIHQQLELIFCEQGEISVIINKEEKIIKKGEIAIADCFDSHQYHHLPFSFSTLLILPVQYLKKYTEFLNDKSLKSHFIFESEKAKKMFECKKMILEYENKNEFIVNGYISILLGLILQDNLNDEKPKEEYSLIRNILLYIEDTYNQKLTLEMIADHFGYSKYYFSHLFNQLFKCNLNDYINLVRCRHTISQILNEQEDILEAAKKNGFTSMRTFYRTFQKFFNMSPKEYFSTRHLYEQ